MTRDAETLAFYDRAAGDYADRFTAAKPGRELKAFVALLPPGGTVLDLGCGPGGTSANLRDAGFSVTASDASQGMLDIARDRFGINGRLATFDQLDDIDAFDGIWCNFSLLHAPRTDMPAHLARIHRALRTNGVLHLGLKLGQGEARDRLGRLYTYYAEAELMALLAASGFLVLDHTILQEKGMAGDIEPAITLRARKDPS